MKPFPIGFGDCGDRKKCDGCKYYVPGNPMIERTCTSPENIEIPDEEARDMIGTYVSAAVRNLMDSIINTYARIEINERKKLAEEEQKEDSDARKDE